MYTLKPYDLALSYMFIILCMKLVMVVVEFINELGNKKILKTSYSLKWKNCKKMGLCASSQAS